MPQLELDEKELETLLALVFQESSRVRRVSAGHSDIAAQAQKAYLEELTTIKVKLRNAED